MGTDGRDYLGWSSNRGNSSERLDRIPGITTIANGTRYYSSVDAEIFFGDLYIGELTSVDWQVQQNALPIYGYNSYCFDDIALGNRIVQGQFSINFTEANWLQGLQDNPGFSKIARRQYGTDPMEESVYSDYRKRLNLPKWDKGFDIVIGYGYHQTQIGKVRNTSTSCYTVLDCCQITGCRSQLDYQGQPVQEIYSFIARDVKDAMASDAEKNPSDNNNTNTDVDNEKPGEINATVTIDMSSKEISVFSPDKVEWVGTGEAILLNEFTDKKLNSKIRLFSKDSYMYNDLEQSFVNSLQKEIEEKNIRSIKCKIKVSYNLMYENSMKKFTANITTTAKIKK